MRLPSDLHDRVAFAVNRTFCSIAPRGAEEIKTGTILQIHGQPKQLALEPRLELLQGKAKISGGLEGMYVWILLHGTSS